VSRSIGHRYFDGALRTKRRIILFDEVDGISGRGDRGGVREIINVIKRTHSPVFLTANDFYDPKLRALRSYCLGVHFQQLTEGEVVRRLAAICTSEGVEAEVSALRRIAQNANGDLRVAINDLQALAEGVSTLRREDVEVYARNTRLQTFDALRAFFSATTRVEARRAIESATINYETMMQCIHENLPYQFRDVRDLAVAYDVLSNANLFLKRAHRERVWRLLRYFFDLLTEIPLVRKYGRSSNYVRFSQKLVAMSRSRSQRALLREIGTRIGRKCHISSSAAITEVVPYLKVISSANPAVAAGLHEWFEFDEQMSEYLRAT
jgi:replication factor C large subunit